jgi:YidC/Oxa1 family membrane protein insertase
MDNKNFFRALFWALLAFLIWTTVAQRIWPPPKPPAVEPNQATPGAVNSNGLNVGSDGATRPDQTVSDTAAPDDGGLSDDPDSQSAVWQPVGAAEATSLTLGDTTGDRESPYRMALSVSNMGASVASVSLSDHPQRASKPERYQLLHPIEHAGQTWRSFSLDRAIINGNRRIKLGDVPWHATLARDAQGETATFALNVGGAGAEVLAVERSYRITPQPVATGRHDVSMVTRVRNLSDQPIRVQLVGKGAVGVTREGRFQQDQKGFAAVREEGLIQLEVVTFEDVAKKNGRDLYPRSEGESSPLEWFGTGNLYFTATQCPVNADGLAEAGRVKSVRAIDLDGLPATRDDVTIRVAWQELRLESGEERTLHSALYLGPKDREDFENPANADYVGRDYMAQIKEGYGACTFNFLTDMMIGLLNWLESVFRNFGVAIIILVMIVRVLLHPITKKTQVNMVRVQQRMAKLHPKIAELKKRHGNDAMKLNQETMKLYREEGINPMSQGMSCLPMMLQMPIWIALYSSLRNNVAMRCEGFIWWINDLTAPDALHTFASPISMPLVGWKLSAFNLLPLLVGVVMFTQQKLMPKPKHEVAVDSPQAQQAEQMQKIMPYMSLVMIIFFYNLPSGLNLYIMTSSLVGALEQLYIRRHISQQDLQAPAQSAQAAKRGGKQPAVLEWLQKKAEEAQKLQSQRDQGKRRR